MKKKHHQRKTRVILWSFTFLWLLFVIWGSSQDGEATANTSIIISKLVISLLRFPDSSLEQVDHILRTLMHFVNFFVLSGLLYAALRVTWPAMKHPAVWTLLSCGALAVLDEVKKLLIAGRHLSWPEAGLNCLGVLAGVCIVMASFYGANRIKQKRS